MQLFGAIIAVVSTMGLIADAQVVNATRFNVMIVQKDAAPQVSPAVQQAPGIKLPNDKAPVISPAVHPAPGIKLQPITVTITSTLTVKPTPTTSTVTSTATSTPMPSTITSTITQTSTPCAATTQTSTVCTNTQSETYTQYVVVTLASSSTNTSTSCTQTTSTTTSTPCTDAVLTSTITSTAEATLTPAPWVPQWQPAPAVVSGVPSGGGGAQPSTNTSSSTPPIYPVTPYCDEVDTTQFTPYPVSINATATGNNVTVLIPLVQSKQLAKQVYSDSSIIGMSTVTLVLHALMMLLVA